MGNKKHNCEDCIWYDQCIGTGTMTADCDDYTPAEDDGVAHYDSVLAENVAEYRLVEEEYSDGRDS